MPFPVDPNFSPQIAARRNDEQYGPSPPSFAQRRREGEPARQGGGPERWRSFAQRELGEGRGRTPTDYDAHPLSRDTAAQSLALAAFAA